MRFGSWLHLPNLKRTLMPYTALQLAVTEPCDENWEAMTPVANTRARHCDSCAKNVVDFTGMSDGRLHEYLRSNPGKLCGRFRPDQLGRPVAARVAPSRSPLRIAAAAVGLLATAAGCESAGSEVMMGELMPIELNERGPIPVTGGITIEEVDETKGALLPEVVITAEQRGIPIPEDPFVDDMIMGLIAMPIPPEPTGLDAVKDTIRDWLDSPPSSAPAPPPGNDD